MKLQKQLSRRAGETKYAKWVVVIPPSKVKDLGWKEGEILDSIVKGGRLVLVPIRVRSSEGKST